MRKDENGYECPATLGEYRNLCLVFAPFSAAVDYLDDKIADDPDGHAAVVIAPDSQMRALLLPMFSKPGRRTTIAMPDVTLPAHNVDSDVDN